MPYFLLKFFYIILFLTIICKYKSKNNVRYIKDVLFINGYDKTMIGFSYKYRILNLIEELNASFIESSEYFYLNFEPIIVRDYRVIIFSGCPWTSKVEEAIVLAKNLNKKILFDIDDFIFNKKFKNKFSSKNNFSLNKEEFFNETILEIGKIIRLSDGIITTNEYLSNELKDYASTVFINRNTINEDLWRLSQNALMKKNNNIKLNDNIMIGCFCDCDKCGSDFIYIKSSLVQILKEFKNTLLILVGQFSLPNYLKEFSSQIIHKKTSDLKKLPEIFTSFDINIAPLENNILNNIKNENAWVLASLMKVPTIASNYGIFKNVIKNNKTGLLCSKENDWYLLLKTLINNEQYRKNLGENAYKYCEIEYNTLYNGYKLGYFINLISNKHIGFYLPSLEIYGGIYVILKHALILKSIGWDVDLIIKEGNIEMFEFQGQQFNVISLKNSFINSQYDIIVATYFTTLYSILNYYKTKRYLYLVQGYETNFFQYGNIFRIMAEKTYSTSFDIEYITISTWCKNWLWEKYKKKAKYSPNGIDLNNFTFYKRNLKKKKIRILIEGDSNSYYKNVDESFKIIEKLDKNNFEVWYLSSSGKPKNWYRYDKFYNKIPLDQVKKIYYDCDILIKSSWLESFSYPPLEMIATGGYCIAVPNEGNKEYLRNEENCLFYDLGDIESAVKNINRLINDDKLQEILFTNGLLTARKRDWKNYINQVIQLYENQ